MSYDISITVKTVDGVDIGVYSSNITYNIRAMLEEAGLCKSLNEFNGKTCRDLWPVFFTAHHAIYFEPDRVRAKESSNGWGTFKDMVPWFTELYEAVLTHRSGVIEIS